MNKAYFFVNGVLFSNSDPETDGLDYIKLDDKYFYEVTNYGVRKTFDGCKSGAIWDITTTAIGNENIIPDSYIAIFEIELEKSLYDLIDDEYAIAEFNVWELIEENKDQLIYSGRYNDKKEFIENFINQKEISNVGGL